MAHLEEGRIVLWGLAGSILAGVAIASCAVGCLGCCYFSQTYRNFCSRCFRKIKKDKDDYQQLDEEPEAIPMVQRVSSRNSDEQEDTPEDVERGVIRKAPKPRKSIDATKTRANPKDDKAEKKEDDKSADVEKGRVLKRLLSTEKGDKEAGKKD